LFKQLLRRQISLVMEKYYFRKKKSIFALAAKIKLSDIMQRFLADVLQTRITECG